MYIAERVKRLEWTHKQTGMEEDWRGLHPAVGGERLKMMIMMMKILLGCIFPISLNFDVRFNFYLKLY
jgi:hypothetical protein